MRLRLKGAPPPDLRAAPRFDPALRARLSGRDLIVVLGAQKAGTTWLHRAIRRDPGVADGGLKEWHVLDGWFAPPGAEKVGRIMEKAARAARRPEARAAHAARRAALARPEAWIEHFSAAAPEARAYLDVTPSYALLRAEDWLLARRHAEAAGLRLRPVFVMRDPARRLFSWARSFAGLRGGAPEAALRSALADPAALARSRYEATLAALWSVFPREEVEVAFYETLTTEPASFRPLARRLGLRVRAAPSERRNASPEAPPPAALLAEAEARLAGTYAFVRRWYGPGIPATWAAARP